MIDRANEYLARITNFYFEEPKKLIQAYEEKYNFLIDGRAQAEVEKFNAENHTFDEYTAVCFCSAQQKIIVEQMISFVCVFFVRNLHGTIKSLNKSC